MNEPLIVRFLKRNQKPFNRSIQIEQGEKTLRVRFGHKTRIKRYFELPGFGRSAELESIGVNKNLLQVTIKGETHGTFPATKDEVDARIRRIRPDDLDDLRRIEAREEALKEQLAKIRIERLNFLHDAFQRGHKVTVKEMVQRAEGTYDGGE